MGVPQGSTLRRVGFRAGTTGELTALHAVEAPIEAERGSNRMPQDLASYIAFARNLPSQFEDHAWLVEAPDATPIAAGYCWCNVAGDQRVMECDLLVHRDHRRQGIGSRLLRAICETTAEVGRSVLTWSTFDAAPAGEAFSRQVGGRAARVNRTSELLLEDVDWPMVASWGAGRGRQAGYQVEMVEGPFPEGLRADAAALHLIMNTAPREDLDIGDVIIDEAFVAELDRALVEAGRTRWTVFVRDPSGACVGGTEVTFEPERAPVAHQQNTGTDPAHRGLGLAKWAKAVMLERLRREAPGIERMRTDNAFSNAAMLAINDSLGFKVISKRIDWHAEVGDVLQTLR